MVADCSRAFVDAPHLSHRSDDASPSRAFREVHGHEMASLDGALHLEPIVRLPSCCTPPKFGDHHGTCEDQFGECGGHHHHQLGWLGLKKIKTRAGSPSSITSMAR